MTFAPSILLWPFFWLVFLASVWYVFAQMYHWLRYGSLYPLVWVAMPVYLVGVVALIGAMLTGIGML